MSLVFCVISCRLIWYFLQRQMFVLHFKMKFWKEKKVKHANRVRWKVPTTFLLAFHFCFLCVRLYLNIFLVSLCSVLNSNRILPNWFCLIFLFESYNIYVAFGSLIHRIVRKWISLPSFQSTRRISTVVFCSRSSNSLHSIRFHFYFRFCVTYSTCVCVYLFKIFSVFLPLSISNPHF